MKLPMDGATGTHLMTVRAQPCALAVTYRSEIWIASLLVDGSLCGLLMSAGQIHELFGQLDDFSWKSPDNGNRR